MPSRSPEDWIKLFMKRTGMLPTPGSKLAHAISKAAADTRKEALQEALDVCLEHIQDPCDPAEESATKISILIKDNEQKMKDKSLWGNDDQSPEEECIHTRSIDPDIAQLRWLKKDCPLCGQWYKPTGGEDGDRK